jgi:NADH-quinone oxidoreductase subunit M
LVYHYPPGRWFTGLDSEPLGSPFFTLVTLIALAANLVLALAVWFLHYKEITLAGNNAWFLQLDQPWIPTLGIHFHLGMDGISLLLVLLTNFLGIVAVASSWTEIEQQTGFFHFNLAWVLAGITGVFLALDMFLFYFFWEMMLVPMYFLIVLWGHEHRVYAAIKFFLFTQLSGLLMLVSILGLYILHGQSTGVYTFDYFQLLQTTLAPRTAIWLMSGFLIAFFVKLPVVPVHTWLPDAHTEAPTAGSIILAGLLLKTGAYGLLRFVVPLFPGAAMSFTPVAMTLGVIGILYGALLAFAQTDLKRLVAYTSVSHMGFVLLGIFAWDKLSLQGVVLQMICHGVSTGALFALVGALQQRIHTRDIRQMGGLWSVMPSMGGAMLVFALASLGLPGMGNFVSEFLILIGTYQVSILAACLAALGLISAAIYALWMIQSTFHGAPRVNLKLPDLSGREIVLITTLILLIIGIGLAPQPVINTARQSLDNLLPSITASTSFLETGNYQPTRPGTEMGPDMMDNTSGGN